jgi:hypothetical protein
MMLRPALLSLLLTAPALAAPALAAPASRDAAPEVLRLWVDARAGTGKPVHWLADGGVYAYPSGKKLAGMVGFDTSTVIWPAKAGDPIIHLTRKTFAYTHPETGEILTEINGQKVEPIAYPYQMITYRFDGERIYGDVEQGVGKAVQQIKAKDGMRWRWMGNDMLAVTAPVFLDFKLPNGAAYEAWENYDFFLSRKASGEMPYRMAWQRYGAAPAFLGGGQAIYHLLSWRVDSTAAFPPKLLAWAQREKPQWLKPPASVDEVRALQKGEAGEDWAK